MFRTSRTSACNMHRRRTRVPVIAGLLLGALLLGGCVTNPVTGRSELALITPAQEISIGDYVLTNGTLAADSLLQIQKTLKPWQLYRIWI